MARDNGPLSLMPCPARHHLQTGHSFGFSLPIFRLHYLICYYFLSCAAAAGVSGKERDYGVGPKFVCTPIPPEADPSCYPPPTVAHGPSSNSQINDNGGGNHRTLMSDEAQTTILHLRESLVRQKETILDQRETIRELTAKLTLCESYGGHHSISHHDKYNHHGTHHNNHPDSHYSHHDDHHGHHGSNHGSHHDSYHGNHHEMHHGSHHGTHHNGHHSSHHNSPHGSHHDGHHGIHHDSHHGSSLLHHGTSAPHGSDLHHSHNSHGTELEQPKGSYSKLSSISAEQTGKTLQTLKERLENLQARNSSSSYSSSLRELLQRKISSLEEQLHSYYRDQHESGHHNEHHGSPHIDHHDSNHNSSLHNGHMYNHHDGHHGTGHPHGHDDHYNTGHPYGHHFEHHGTGHHEDHHNSHHGNHHGSHPYSHHSSHYGNHHHDHNYDWHRGQHYGHYDNHHSSHHNGHHMDHHNNHHGSNHHDAHNNYHHGHHDRHHDNHHGPSHYGNDHHWDDHGNNPHVNDHHSDDDHPQHLPFTGDKETSLQGTNHSKLETVLSQLHHSNEQGNNKKLKRPSAFLLDFPMRTNYMYARMKRSVVSEIFALTICLWLKPREGPGLGTPISYAVPGQANELVLMEWGSNPMELLINDKAVTLPINVMDGKWHHVCVTWSTRDGVWEAYQDGVKKGAGQNLSAWHPIQPGGIFILGQEQDTMGGRFDVTQSFTGELSDLQFWSRVLTANEIHTQATCGGHFVGDVMSWSEEYVEVHGGLAELPFDPCH